MIINKQAAAVLAGGLVIIAAIIYFIFIHDFNRTDDGQPDGGTPPTEQPAEIEPVFETVGEPSGATAPPRTSTEVNRDQIEQMSTYFAVRYGTSSSQADFANLEDLELFVTPAMWERLSATINEERAALDETPAYESITTQVIVADIETFSDIIGSAEVMVRTKRLAVDASGETREFSQNLDLSLRRDNGEWKIDNAVWVE